MYQTLSAMELEIKRLKWVKTRERETERDGSKRDGDDYGDFSKCLSSSSSTTIQLRNDGQFPTDGSHSPQKRGKGRYDILTLKVTQIRGIWNLVITIEPPTFMQKSQVRFSLSTLVDLNTKLWNCTTLSNQLWRQLWSSSSVLGLPFPASPFIAHVTVSSL